MNILLINNNLKEDNALIPYVFRLARDLDARVRVLHVIDRRNMGNIYSGISDSQTLSPKVLSPDEVIKKESLGANNYLDKKISREASVLNYPLKVDYEVVADKIEKRVLMESARNENDVIVMSSTPDGNLFQDIRDIHFVVNRSECPVLLVPENKEYLNPDKILIASFRNRSESDELNETFKILNPLKVKPEFIESTEAANLGRDPEKEKNVDLLVILRKRPGFFEIIFKPKVGTILKRNQDIPVLVIH
jgi:nucleotide-binding universal stress UspA family protein